MKSSGTNRMGTVEAVVLAAENQIAILIENRNPRTKGAICVLFRKIDDFESRIERVSRMNFLQELARDLGESDEYFPDVLRKQRCAGSGKRQQLRHGE
jgi:hypothetical protein